MLTVPVVTPDHPGRTLRFLSPRKTDGATIEHARKGDVVSPASESAVAVPWRAAGRSECSSEQSPCWVLKRTGKGRQLHIPLGAPSELHSETAALHLSQRSSPRQRSQYILRCPPTV